MNIPDLSVVSRHWTDNLPSCDSPGRQALALKDPSHPEQKEIADWFEPSFDLNEFKMEFLETLCPGRVTNASMNRRLKKLLMGLKI